MRQKQYKPYRKLVVNNVINCRYSFMTNKQLLDSYSYYLDIIDNLPDDAPESQEVEDTLNGLEDEAERRYNAGTLTYKDFSKTA